MISKASFFIFILTIFSATTFAISPTSSWKEIYRTSEHASGPAGFEILQSKYPSLFGRYSLKDVSSANVDTIIHEFTGIHTCADDDPGLRRESQAYGLCEITGACFQTAPTFPQPPTDPCAN